MLTYKPKQKQRVCIITTRVIDAKKLVFHQLPQKTQQLVTVWVFDFWQSEVLARMYTTKLLVNLTTHQINKRTGQDDQ